MKRSFFFIVLALFNAAIALSQIPQTMSYQGVLTDASGKAVPDGAYTMTFKLYEQATGGAALWQEQQSATVNKGILNVILGRVTPLALSFDKPYWLGISIAGNPEMTPRIALTASAYSLNARGVSGESNVFPSSSNVGIGTTNPNAPLTVGIAGGTTWASNIQLLRQNTQLDARIAIALDGLLFRNFSITSTAYSFRNSTDTNLLEILANGNVGIGTGSNPTEKLQVAGIIHSTAGGFKFPDGTIQTTAASGGGVGDGHSLDAADGDPKDVVFVNNDGNVGIGTTNPNAPLTVGIAGGTTWASNIQLLRQNTQLDARIAIALDGLLFRNFSITSTAYSFRNSTDTNLLEILANGNVGIGTGSPANILTVQQNSATDPIADAWTTYSSRRWKTNIKTLESALNKIQRLRGVSYDWKSNSKHDIGLIAEEVGDVIPEVVAYEENGKDAKSVDYTRLVALLIEGMKEQQTTINALTKRVEALEGIIAGTK